MGNGRCRFHGGKSTGPTTLEGAEQARQATLRHGFQRLKWAGFTSVFNSQLTIVLLAFLSTNMWERL
jgi:hypothetical protein